jgi:hypothetical protein
MKSKYSYFRDADVFVRHWSQLPMLIHGDRGSVKDCKKDLKVKAKGPLTTFLAIVKDTLAELRRDPSTEHVRYQLLHIRDILERWKVR